MAVQLSKHHFWQWFLRHNKEYLELNKKSKKELAYWKNELQAHLRAYYKFLYFSIYVPEKGDSGVLTISVSGKAGYFKYVDNLVALAPQIPGWKIQALEPPRPIDFLWQEQVGHVDIDPRELWCTVPEGERGRLSVYHMLYTEADNWSYSQVAEAAVYNVLGERSFGLDIGRITVSNLSHAPQGAELIRVEELPAYMTRGKSGLVVDVGGEIREGE
jgi:hypothetical protein